jgi:hypothetical protein
MKKRVVRKKKKHEERCVCCRSRRVDFEREVERLTLATLRRLALAMTNKKEREALAMLLQTGFDRLLEIDQRPETIDHNRV